jgi:hypothetical protein
MRGFFAPLRMTGVGEMTVIGGKGKTKLKKNY